MTALQKLLETKLAEIGKPGHWWMPTPPKLSFFFFRLQRRDAKAFLAFENADTLSGVKLVISVNESGSTPKPKTWYMKQRSLINRQLLPAYVAAQLINKSLTPEQALKVFSPQTLAGFKEAGLLTTHNLHAGHALSNEKEY